LQKAGHRRIRCRRTFNYQITSRNWRKIRYNYITYLRINCYSRCKWKNSWKWHENGWRRSESNWSADSPTNLDLGKSLRTDPDSRGSLTNHWHWTLKATRKSIWKPGIVCWTKRARTGRKTYPWFSCYKCNWAIAIGIRIVIKHSCF